jgi:1,4-alpha-glucan branching enzyme
MSDRSRGELAIVLHSHMPYVEGFGTWPFGEEWLFEAMAASYLPLIDLCERWAERGDADVLTIGVTPVLADQLVLPEVGERFLRFVLDVREETHRLDVVGLEGAGQAEAAAALRHSARDYERAAEHFERMGRDLVGTLRRLREAGVVDLWCSTATHAVLPLVATEAGARLQLGTGIESHRTRFGAWTGGLWLPECAYRSGLEHDLAAAGVRAFCVDQTAEDGDLDQLEPAATGSGAVAVPIDWRTISLVWDERGLPADRSYRDYHAQSPNGLRPYANGGGPYLPAAASERAREHAREFVVRVLERLDRYRAERARAGLLVFALDTELLGHWWYEGPQFLAAVVDEARAAGLALATLPEALERHPARERPLRDSSWGRGKDLATWDSPPVADLVWPARQAELRLAALIGARPDGSAAVARAARELLALQASDWAFMVSHGLAGEYPRERVRSHAGAFERAVAAAIGGVRDSSAMSPALRGLAPVLRPTRFAEPASTWGREAGESPVRPGARARQAVAG